MIARSAIAYAIIALGLITTACDPNRGRTEREKAQGGAAYCARAIGNAIQLDGSRIVALRAGLAAAPSIAILDVFPIATFDFQTGENFAKDPWGQYYRIRMDLQELPDGTEGSSRVQVYSIGRNGVDDLGSGDDLRFPSGTVEIPR